MDANRHFETNVNDIRCHISNKRLRNFSSVTKTSVV
jgi:hypothetical protein